MAALIVLIWAEKYWQNKLITEYMVFLFLKLASVVIIVVIVCNVCIDVMWVNWPDNEA